MKLKPIEHVELIQDADRSLHEMTHRVMVMKTNGLLYECILCLLSFLIATRRSTEKRPVRLSIYI